MEHQARHARGVQRMTRIQPDENIQLPAGETATFGTMSTLFRTMGRRPEIMQHSMQLLEAVMRTGTVEPRLKELLAVRVSQVNYCFY